MVVRVSIELDGRLNVSGSDARSRPGDERCAAAAPLTEPRYPERSEDLGPETLDRLVGTFPRQQLACQR